MRLMKKLATLAIWLRSPPLRGQLFEARDISLGHLFVNFLREQECDVDVDAFADQLLDSRQAFGGARNFDHHVFAADRFPKRRASAIVPCVLRAKYGETSRLT